MKLLAALAFTVPLMGTTLIAATTAPLLAQMGAVNQPPGAAENEAILSSLRGFADAWNRHDPIAMAQAWSETGTLINPFGREARGRQQIERLFTDEQHGRMHASTMTLQGQPAISFLKPDVAFVDTDMLISGATNVDGAPQPPFRVHFAGVLTHSDEGWRIAHGRPAIYPHAEAVPLGRTPTSH